MNDETSSKNLLMKRLLKKLDITLEKAVQFG